MKSAVNHASRPHAMRLSTTTRAVALNESLQRVIRGSVSAALGRFSEKVHGVFVWIEDTNGPRGGSDRRCRMDLRLKRGGRLTVSAQAKNEYAAVGRAANRARVKLIRKLQKKREGRRRRAETHLHR